MNLRKKTYTTTKYDIYLKHGPNSDIKELFFTMLLQTYMRI